MDDRTAALATLLTKLGGDPAFRFDPPLAPSEVQTLVRGASAS